MRYLHTMVRVKDLDASLHFWGKLFGLQEIRRYENEKGRFTLVFLAAPGDLDHAKAHLSPCLELTYNWDTEDYTGGRNVVINRPPRDGHMAFVRSPDGISIEILQKGENLPSQEPWASMGNTGAW
jgi:lactoylglutathione lyase